MIMGATRLRAALLAAVAGFVGASGVASAGWYFANTAGNYGPVSNGSYTTGGGLGSWAFGRLDNQTTGLPKFHFRVLYNAGCSGSSSQPQWYSGNYGNPRAWQINYSSGGCGYSYGQNASGGTAFLAAGQF